MIQAIKLSPEQWANLSKESNAAVFGEVVEPANERIDFALLTLEDDKPLGFLTFQEKDSESLYLQYGGVVLGARGRGTELLDFNFKGLFEQGYKRISFLVENTNIVMLKVALKIECLIIGVRNYKGKVFVEFGKEV